MGVSAFFRDLLRFTLFGGDFSWAFWAGSTLSLVLLAAVLSTIAPRIVDPIAVEVAVRPGRVAKWIPLSFLLWGGLITLLALSIIGVALAVGLLFFVIGAAYVGLVSVSMVTGDRIVYGRFGRTVPPWQAAILGVMVFRIIRLVPYLGPFIFGIVCLISLAAASALIWDVCWSWHRRRMPDEQQFAGEKLIEWDEVADAAPHSTPTPLADLAGPLDPRFAWRQRP